MTKKLISVFLSIIMIVLFAPMFKNITVIRSKALDDCEFSYRSMGSTCEITGFSPDIDPYTHYDSIDLYFPSKINDMRVVGIADYAFAESEVHSLHFADSITYIGEGAFSNCNYLNYVDFEDTNIETISDFAFCNCKYVENYILPDTLKTIGTSAFGNNLIDTLLFPASVTDSADAFSGSTINNLIIEDGTVEIPEYAFYDCCLQRVVVPSSIKNIGVGAFVIPYSVEKGIYYFGNDEEFGNIVYNSKQIKEFSYSTKDKFLKSNIRYNSGIYENMIYSCFSNSICIDEYIDALNTDYSSKICIPSEINGIPVFNVNLLAFNDNLGIINTIYIGEGIKGLYGMTDDEIFHNQITLYLPSSIEFIDAGAFSLWGFISQIYFNGTEEQFSKIFVDENNSCLGSTPKYFGKIIYDDFLIEVTDEGTAIIKEYFGSKDVVIPSYIKRWPVTEIASSAFYNDVRIESVIIGDKVKTIGSDAFYRCENLKSVTMRDNVEKISVYAFGSCYNLEEVDISSSVRKIENGTFSDCRSLKTLHIPEGVNIVDDAFSGATSLSELYVPKSVNNLNLRWAYDHAPLTVFYAGAYYSWNNIDFSINYSWDENGNIHFYYLDNVTFVYGEESYNYDTLKYVLDNNGNAVIAGFNGYAVKNRFIPLSIDGHRVTEFERNATLHSGPYTTDLYFEGSAEQWNEIIIGQNNSLIKESTVHFGADKSSVKKELFGDCIIENGKIYGLNPGTDIISATAEIPKQYVNLNVKNAETKNLGTGSIIQVKYADTSIEEFEVVIFGDINGDSWYDGMDAIIVNCLANGMLTREQVGEAVYMAADCNHDGIIDSNDVDILQQAGLLLASVDQSKPQEELQTNSAYVEYLNLIDQTPVNEETQPETEPEQIPSALDKLIAFIADIYAFLVNFIKTIFA